MVGVEAEDASHLGDRPGMDTRAREWYCARSANGYVTGGLLAQGISCRCRDLAAPHRAMHEPALPGSADPRTPSSRPRRGPQ